MVVTLGTMTVSLGRAGTDSDLVLTAHLCALLLSECLGFVPHLPLPLCSSLKMMHKVEAFPPLSSPPLCLVAHVVAAAVLGVVFPSGPLLLFL